MLLFIQTDCGSWTSILWPLIGAFLLGALLGWLLKNLLGGGDSGTDWESRYNSTKADLDACRRNAKKASASLAGGSTNLGAGATASSFAANTATNVKKTVTKVTKADDSVKDDLTKVEGIGPKIQEHLNKNGIWSWKQLSNTAESTLQGILNAAGPAYTIHKPKTWAEQALMAHKGEWKKLEKWQDELKGGL